VTEQLSSRENTTNVSTKDGRYILDDGALDLKYKTADEAVHMAMLKNRCDGKYKVEHPDFELKYQSYMGV